MPTKKNLQDATIEDLKLDSRNPRVRTERSAELINTSLQKFGGMRSIVLDENNVVRAGNGTVTEAKELGFQKVKIIDAEGDELIAVRRKGLTEKDWIQYGVADNRSSDLSEWDTELLLELDDEFDLGDSFEEFEIEEFESSLDAEVGVTGEHKPIDQKKLADDEKTMASLLDDLGVKKLPCRVEPGQIWELGDHRLICGDSTDPWAIAILMNWEAYTGKTANLIETT